MSFADELQEILDKTGVDLRISSAHIKLILDCKIEEYILKLARSSHLNSVTLEFIFSRSEMLAIIMILALFNLIKHDFYSVENVRSMQEHDNPHDVVKVLLILKKYPFLNKRYREDILKLDRPDVCAQMIEILVDSQLIDADNTAYLDRLMKVNNSYLFSDRAESQVWEYLRHNMTAKVSDNFIRIVEKLSYVNASTEQSMEAIEGYVKSLRDKKEISVAAVRRRLSKEEPGFDYILLHSIVTLEVTSYLQELANPQTPKELQYFIDLIEKIKKTVSCSASVVWHAIEDQVAFDLFYELGLRFFSGLADKIEEENPRLSFADFMIILERSVFDSTGKLNRSLNPRFTQFVDLGEGVCIEGVDVGLLQEEVMLSPVFSRHFQEQSQKIYQLPRASYLGFFSRQDMLSALRSQDSNMQYLYDKEHGLVEYQSRESFIKSLLRR